MLRTTYVSGRDEIERLSLAINREIDNLTRQTYRVISIHPTNVYAGKDNTGRSQFLYEALIVYEDNK